VASHKQPLQPCLSFYNYLGLKSNLGNFCAEISVELIKVIAKIAIANIDFFIFIKLIIKDFQICHKK
jgi:hypothetical protein